MSFKVFNDQNLQGVYGNLNTRTVIDGIIKGNVLTLNLSKELTHDFEYNLDIISPTLSINFDELKVYDRVDIFCDIPNLYRFEYKGVNDFRDYIKFNEASYPNFRIFKDKNDTFIINRRNQPKAILRIKGDGVKINDYTVQGSCSDYIKLIESNSTDPNVSEALNLNYRKKEIIYKFYMKILELFSFETIENLSILTGFILKESLLRNQSMTNSLPIELSEFLNSDMEIPTESILTLINKNKEYHREKQNFDTELERIDSRLNELRLL